MVSQTNATNVAAYILPYLAAYILPKRTILSELTKRILGTLYI